MRFCLSLVTLFSLALSANAAAIHKRAAANVESCVSDLNTIITQIDILQPSLQTGGFIDTSIDYQRLQDSIQASQGSCCAINIAISDADANYVISTMGNVTPKVQGILTTISEKKSDYNVFTKTILNLRIKKLQELTGNVDTCLINFTPESEKAALQTYITSIDLAFTQTLNAYPLY